MNLKMILFMYMLMTNFNPMNMVVNFSFFFIMLMMNFMIFNNDKWMMILLIIFFVGGMMIFMSLICSTMKFNFLMKKKSYLTSFIFLIFLFNMMLSNSFLISLSMFNNTFMFFLCFLIMMMMFLFKNILFKKQKSIKMYVIYVYMFMY